MEAKGQYQANFRIAPSTETTSGLGSNLYTKLWPDSGICKRLHICQLRDQTNYGKEHTTWQLIQRLEWQVYLGISVDNPCLHSHNVVLQHPVHDV